MSKRTTSCLVAIAVLLCATNIYTVVKLHDLGHQVGVTQSRAKLIEDCLYVKQGFRIYDESGNLWHADKKPVCRFEK